MSSAASPDSTRARRKWRTGVMGVIASLLLLGTPILYRAHLARQELSGFIAVQAAGFTVLVSPSLQSDPELKERVMWRLEEQLASVVTVLPESGREVLRETRIWVDPDPTIDSQTTPAGVPVARYLWQQPSAEHHQRAGDIEILDVYRFIRLHGQYQVLLHELAHAYDDRQSRFQDPWILKAFNAARRKGLYDQLSGSDDDSSANVDAREYFAVLTEAYFSSRPNTPHNRRELKLFDPQGYQALERLWGMD